MRWHSRDFKNKVRPHGSYRIIWKFLWFPKVLGNEVRWLCYTWIVQQWLEYEDGVARWSSQDWYDGSKEGIVDALKSLEEMRKKDPFPPW
jgi:hypothetical protein